jgi:putative 4-mercaptohistidine N1-methyltranferase
MPNPYETRRLVDEYLLFHYGGDDEILPWAFGPRAALGFPLRTVARFAPGEVARALDLGCAVGRSTFELSRTCRAVTGIDFSRAFIDAARRLQEGQTLVCERLEEAGRHSRVALRLPPGVRPERVSFETGDAMDLRPDLGSFDRVHAANLLCRLSDPSRLLARLPSLVQAGGQLVLATPCTWLEEFTPPGHWPPGTTFEWLCRALAPDFELTGCGDEPFLIRETARKFQWTVAQVSVWQRR